MPPNVVALGFGSSAPVSEHGAKVVAEPHVPMTWWPVCPVFGLTARVPEVVTGDPATDSHDGTVRATLVTVPEPDVL